MTRAIEIRKHSKDININVKLGFMFYIICGDLFNDVRSENKFTHLHTRFYFKRSISQENFIKYLYIHDHECVSWIKIIYRRYKLFI